MMCGINERVRIFINNIRDDNNIESNLQELNVSLRTLNSRQLSEIAQSCPLSSLFDCLNSSNESQILTTCEVLKIILPAVPVTQLISQNGPALVRALGHPTVEVKVVVLEELIRAVGSNGLGTALENDANLLSSVGKCLCHEDVSVGKRATEFFIKLGKTKSGLAAICRPEFVRELIENIGENNVYALRVFQVLVEICSTSEHMLKVLENEGILDRLTVFFETEDTLAKLALVEVCTKMAVTTYGWEFLSRHRVIKNIVKDLVKYQDNPLSSLTFPGLTRFFGQISQHHLSKLMRDYPEVVECAFNAVDSDDYIICMSSLELLGMIAYSSEGKSLLQKQDEKYMRHAIGRIYECMTKLPTEWKIRGLHVLANVIHIETESLTPEINRLHEMWFNQLGSNALSFIVQRALQPFSDDKAAALLVIFNMANQRWGQTKIADFPGLVDYLLHRAPESEAEALQMKFKILKRIADSETSEGVFPARIYDSILQYIKQGPFYVAITTEVAIQGAD